MKIVHLTASPFFGGPERQMLGLARALPSEYAIEFISFPENGRCRPFLQEVGRAGFMAHELAADTPHFRRAIQALSQLLRTIRADVILSHGYKSNLLGRIAARRIGIPIVGVARGWTSENRKVQVYEALDRWHLKKLDRVVAVSRGMAAKVRATGFPEARLQVICNGARLSAFRQVDPTDRQKLRDMVPGLQADEPLIVGAGRLTPDKGFHILLEAMARIIQHRPKIRLMIFGQGASRSDLQAQVRRLNLEDRVVFGGFRDDLDRLIPWADLFVLPSFNEGLPNVLLEAGAAGVACVATAVSGTPEVLLDGQTGYLVPPGNPEALAERLLEVATNAKLRQRFGQAAKRHIEANFTFENQAKKYQELFDDLVPHRSRKAVAA